jgi:hypothetical protein
MKRNAILLLFAATLLMLGPALNQVAAAPVLSITAQPVDHLAGCVAIEEIARGDSIPFLVNVTYVSNGQPMSQGNVNVTLSNGATLKLFYNGGSKIWANAYDIPWNAATGPLGYTVVAEDNQSDVSVFKPVSPEGLLQIVPANLHVNATIEDPTTNQTVTSVSSGQTVKIEGFVAYPLPGQGFPTQKALPPSDAPVLGAGELLNSTLVSNATAVVGIGTFNATSGTFSQYTSGKMKMSYDSASQSWTTTYTFKSGQPTGLYQAAIMANDTSSPSNSGYSLSLATAFGIATTQSLLTTTNIAFLAAGVLIVGLIVGTVLRPRGAKLAQTKMSRDT